MGLGLFVVIFNVSRFVSGKKSCVRRTKGMREFSDFVEDMGLIDLQMENATFTWYKGYNHEVASRIVKILISEEWDESFNNLKLIPLQRIISDHVPLALQGGTWNKHKRYFKFKNWWLDTKGFTDKVRDLWNNFNFGGRPDYVLTCKMKALKNKLKEWSREVQGNLGLLRKKLLEKLADFDSVVKKQTFISRRVHKER